jgi:hypothetical protein
MAMKKTIGLPIILLLLSVSVQAGTDPNRWDGFRGLKWGTNIKDVNDPNMILRESRDEVQIYMRSNDKLRIGDAQLAGIGYMFYKDRFFTVAIKAKGYTNFTALKDAVFAYYGQGKQLDEFNKEWTWLAALGNSDKDVRMELSYNESSQETILAMIYLPIFQEKNADDAKKAIGAGSNF